MSDAILSRLGGDGRKASRPGRAVSGRVRALLPLALVTLTACGGLRGEAPPKDGPDSVAFRIEQVTVGGTRHTWRATYPDGGSFRIELDLVPQAEKATFASGAFGREEGVDSGPFLKSAARALGARDVPATSEGYRRLPFEAAILGRNLSRGKGTGNVYAGGYTSDPRGGWIVTKVFLGDEGAEFFLSVNPELGWGEMAMKDAGYGRDVVRGLAQVLQGPVTSEQPRTPTPQPTPEPIPTPDAVFDNFLRIVVSPRPEEQAWKRVEAIQWLGRRGSAHRAVSISALKGVLADTTSSAPHSVAIEALARIDPTLSECEADVRAYLNARHPAIRLVAARTLVRAGHRKDTLAVLQELAEGEYDDLTKGQAVSALGQLGAEAAPTVPVVIRLSAPHRHPWLRVQAIEALGNIGPSASVAVNLLRVYTRDAQPGVAQAAREALARIEPGR